MEAADTLDSRKIHQIKTVCILYMLGTGSQDMCYSGKEMLLLFLQEKNYGRQQRLIKIRFEQERMLE